ncbi:MAG: flippase [DPANN group archaeon]|nr:flippase [DPANN group archaeon]
MKKQLNTIVKGAGFVFIGMAFSKIFTLLWRIIISHLGPDAYGLFSLVFSISSIVTMLATLGLGGGVLRYVSYYRGKNDKEHIKGVIVSSLKIVTISSIIFAFLLYRFSEFISLSIFNNVLLVPLFKIFSFSVFFLSISDIFFGISIGFENAKYVIILQQILQNFLNVTLSIFLIYLGYNLIGVSIAYVFSAFIILLLSILLIEYKVFPVFNTKIKSKYINNELLNYSIPLVFVVVITQILTWIDTIMIGYFEPISAVGLYNTAVPIANLLLIVPNAFIFLFLSVVTSESAKGNTKIIKEIYLRINKWILLGNLPIFFIIFFYSDYIINIIFGIEYVGAKYALSILSVGYFIKSIFSTTDSMLKLLKNTKILLYITTLTAILNMLLNIILIPKYGINGGAIATTISLIVSSFIFGYIIYKKINIVPINKKILKTIILYGLLIYVYNIIMQTLFENIPFYYIILGYIILNILYILYILKLNLIDKYDFEIIENIKQKLKNSHK